MNGRSPNFNRGGGPNRFYNVTPKHNHQQGMKQPLHLAPNNPYLSPRGNFSVRSGSDSDQQSPDFIPIGYSSPRGGLRYSPNNSWNQDRSNNSWNQGNNYHNRNSFGSNMSSPKSSVSSNFSPYNKFGSHRSRGGFNHSNNSNNNTPIARYCDKSMLEDPWAECEQYMIDNEEKKNTEEMISDTEASSEECETVSNEDS